MITSSQIEGEEEGGDDIVLFASARRSNSRRSRRDCQSAAVSEHPDNQVSEGERTSSGEDQDGDGSPCPSPGQEPAAGRGHIDRVNRETGVIGEGVTGEGDDTFDFYRVTFPRLPQQFTGTGDLAAALLLAWTHKLPGDLAGALERVAGSLKAVLARTHSQGYFFLSGFSPLSPPSVLRLPLLPLLDW